MNLHSLVPQFVKNLYGVHIEGRSPHWPALRAQWLRRHNFCRACGRRDHLQVHHKKPFHTHPELELAPSNLITLCENTPEEDHLQIGHHGNWKNINPNVESDSDALLKKRTGHV